MNPKLSLPCRQAGAIRYTIYATFIFLLVTLSGCAIRSYPLAKDRVDQNLAEGNRGFLKGNIPAIAENKNRKTTRMTRVVEIELGFPAKTKKAKKQNKTTAAAVETKEDETDISENLTENQAEPAINQAFTQYTVEKNDTLQKISQKFYNTTKKWLKIYEDNKNVLKGPNKVYPGQVLKIAQEPIAEIKENLK